MQALHRPLIVIFPLITVFFLLIGCSQISEPTFPDIPSAVEHRAMSPSHHNLLGVWSFTAMPDEGRLDVFELRDANLHLNALRFLEPPVNLHLTVENVQFSGSTVECDVGLRHPFLGQDQYTGFDVCGIVITNGSTTGFSDPGIVMPTEGDTRLLNPDGYTRWWNPVEFPHTDTIFGYKDGLLGTPDGIAQYTSTVNGYKYFCDDLDDPYDPITDVILDNRGMFTAGQMNYRHYQLDISGELVFNYAVDACWKKPAGDFPWTVPDDFPPGANRPEAWNVSVTETENSLWNSGTASGGSLILSIDVYDWFNGDENLVRVESPGNFGMVETTEPVGGGEGYSTYEVEIDGAFPGPYEIDILIAVACESIGYGGLLPGKPVTAYFACKAEVTTESPEISPWPFFKNDVARTGYTAAIGPGVGTSQQEYPAYECANQFESSPVVGGDGTVYIGSETRHLLAFNPDLTFKWKYPPTGKLEGRIEGAPAIGPDGAIYFGTMNFNSKFYGLVDMGDHAVEKWEPVPINTRNIASPLVTNDGSNLVCFGVEQGSYENNLIAINADTGEIAWTLNCGKWLTSGPCQSGDGRLYIGGGGPGILVCAGTDGEKIWDLNIPGRIYRAPSVDSNDNIYCGGLDDKIYCIHDYGNYGEIVWTYTTGGYVYPSPAISHDESIIYAGSWDNNMYALDAATGEYINSFETEFDILGSAAIDGEGNVYFGGYSHIYKTNAQLELMGIFDIFPGEDAGVVSSPAIIDGVVYVGTIYHTNPDIGGYVRGITSFKNPFASPMQFAYSSYKAGNYEIYLTDVDGTFETQLTDHPAVDYMQDFSPDGSILYFKSDRDGDSDIYALDMDTMEITNITHDTGMQYACAVSPDGEWIVTINSWSVLDKDIFRLKADGSMDKSEWINLTNTPGKYSHEPDWSPDGEKIVYYRVNDDTGGNDVWLMDSADGGNKKEIISGPGDEHGPTFSPDGDKVLYSCVKFSTRGMFYYSFSDDQNYTYIDTNLEEHSGEFSPEGEYVIFIIGEPGDIYYAPFPDGGDPIPLVTGPGHDGWAVWRPMQ